MKGGVNLTPLQKKLPPKSPALFELIHTELFMKRYANLGKRLSQSLKKCSRNKLMFIFQNP